MMNDMNAYVGLYSIVTMWLAGAWLLIKWHGKDLLSISRHAASSPMTMLLFAVVLIGVGGMLYAWMWWWLAPKLGLGLVFNSLLVLAYVCQVFTAAIPDVAGWRRLAHKIFAWTMAAVFWPLGWLIATAPDMSLAARILCIVLALYMTFGIASVLAGQGKQRFLFLQASYVVALQLLVLIAAYF